MIEVSLTKVLQYRGIRNGWCRQPQLAVSDWTLGWVRMHTCCTLSNQCAQFKPSITKHSVLFLMEADGTLSLDKHLYGLSTRLEGTINY